MSTRGNLKDQINYWVPSLRLRKEDQLITSKGKWLTDTIIDSYQALLHLGYPHICGLQEVALANTLSFDIQSGNFIQVLNISECHWIIVSNIGCESGTIAIYDSLCSGSVPVRTTEQITSIVYSNNKSIKLQFKSVQTQVGGSDCGLFALAFANSLCASKRPEEIAYTQHKFRYHLLNCLSRVKALPFPRTTRKKKALPPNESIVEIFCKCRLPLGRMVECMKCKEWYHELCVTVPDTIWKNPTAKWYCTDCAL